jgi:hypothetical protein
MNIYQKLNLSRNIKYYSKHILKIIKMIIKSLYINEFLI